MISRLFLEGFEKEAQPEIKPPQPPKPVKQTGDYNKKNEIMVKAPDTPKVKAAKPGLHGWN